MKSTTGCSEAALIVLAEVPRFLEEWGYAPSVRDLGQRLGLAAPSVQYHLELLRQAGLVTWARGCSRTLTVTSEGQRAIK